MGAVVQAGGGEEARVEAEVREGWQEVDEHQVEKLGPVQRPPRQARHPELEVVGQGHGVQLSGGGGHAAVSGWTRI